MDRYDFPNEPAQNKKREPVRVSLKVLIICILLTGILIFSITSAVLSAYYKGFTELKKVREIAELYEKNYLYDVDKETLSEALAIMYLNACGDRFASYYSAEEWAQEQASASGNSVGVGVYATASDTEEILIVTVMEGSPAEKAGLLSGDIVISVDGTVVKEVGYLTALDLFRGESGSEVSMEVRRGEEILSLTAVRSTYTPQTVYAETVFRDGKLYGYVRIAEFLSIQTTYNQLKRAVDALVEANVEGLIFDVRDNTGGDLNAIVRILDYLLPEGPIVHMHYAGVEKPYTYSSGVSEIDLPMVVLVNENTASAAELFAVALRDYGKAELVGQKTFGKGCGQTGKLLSDGSVVFITTFLYNPPYSENYDGIGLFPDHEVETAEKWQNTNLFLVPHEEDDQLLNAIGLMEAKVKDAQS